MAALMISKLFFLLTLTLLALNYNIAEGAIRGKTQRKINKANGDGPFVGIVTGSKSEMNNLLDDPNFTDYDYIIEVAGKSFRFGSIGGQKVIVVMSGSSMINAAITTQLLVNLFTLKGVVHFGVAGIADPSHHIGDVIIPKFWSHSGRWSWQKFGFGPEDPLPLEDIGGSTRELGYLKFSDSAVNVNECSNHDNLLNNIWYQREQIFSIPEKGRHIFWVPANAKYYNISSKLEGMNLDSCFYDACTIPAPKVSIVRRGTSASIYVDNDAYRDFLVRKFEVASVDMESAAVALVCHQQHVPFIAIKGLSDLAGGFSHNDETFGIPLAVKNSVKVTVEFIKLLGQYNVSEPVFDM